LYAALAGAGVVTVIVCEAGIAVVEFVTLLAAV
jgi:hypothetical protein